MTHQLLLPPARATVMLHGFTSFEYEPGKVEQTYAEPDAAEGWCVYVQIERPHDGAQPFDSIGDERDFILEDDAIAHAERLGRELHAEVHDY